MGKQVRAKRTAITLAISSRPINRWPITLARPRRLPCTPRGQEKRLETVGMMHAERTIFGGRFGARIGQEAAGKSSADGQIASQFNSKRYRRYDLAKATKSAPKPTPFRPKTTPESPRVLLVHLSARRPALSHVKIRLSKSGLILTYYELIVKPEVPRALLYMSGCFAEISPARRLWKILTGCGVIRRDTSGHTQKTEAEKAPSRSSSRSTTPTSPTSRIRTSSSKWAPAPLTLLAAAGKEHGWTLIAEQEKKVGGKTIRPDGTFKDEMNLVRGYWEAKDTADDLDDEIEKKTQRATRSTTSSSRTPDRASSIQHGQRSPDAPTSQTRRQLADLLDRVLPLRRAGDRGVRAGRRRVQGARARPGRRAWPRRSSRRTRTNKTFQNAFADFFELCQTSPQPEHPQRGRR